MKKILIVSGSLRIGGLENIAMNFRRYSDKSKYTIDYLVYGDEVGEFEKEARELGCKIYHINKPKKGYFKFYSNLKNIIKNNGPYDIVHSHTFFNTGIVLKAAKSCGIEKCIAHVHSGKRANDSNFKKRISYFFLKKMINKYADIKCACSMASGEYVFGKTVFNKDGIVIPNVVDLDKFVYSLDNRQKIRQEFNISDETFIIGHVGHLLPVKNQLFLLEVFSKYERTYTKDSKLIIVGDGKLKNELIKKVNQYKLTDKVIIAGTRNNVFEIMSAFDVFVLPSLHEGLPLTLVEAMANGLSYVIERDVVANEMKNFKNCICVNKYSVQEWVEAIENSRNRGRFSSENCILQLNNYSINYFKNIVNKIYI